MADFIIPFLLGNVFLCVPFGLLLIIRHFLRNVLSPRMRYHTWFLFLGLLAVPFLPVTPYSILQIPSWLGAWKTNNLQNAAHSMGLSQQNTIGQTGWMKNFSVSVSQHTPSAATWILAALWLLGILVMTMLTIRALIRFRRIRRSALPLQNADVRRLYQECLSSLHIRRKIPIYSTAFLNSPVIAGFLCPRIYLPISLITDYEPVQIRFMLLHELQHYRHKDALANLLMSFASILYWFHPLVWYVRREMKIDREVACDTSVLKGLEKGDYEAYGMTLINFAEKLSLAPFPFATGIGGTMVQMKKRVLNIANYRPPSVRNHLYSLLSFALIAVLLAGLAPALSTNAGNDRYAFTEPDKKISYLDLEESFGEYQGSFVLYDQTADSWKIYHPESAKTRIAPASTYKIYSSLFALDAGIISPEQSRIPWNGQQYPYEEWNADQTLESAIEHSVTWYFQEIDQRMGLSNIRTYVREIKYGNEQVEGDAASYWLNATLKISPIEQVELLQKFYNNQLGFSTEHVEAVKRSICLSADTQSALYGKTGTEEIGGKNTSGWFIGYLEQQGHTYFFATNIQKEDSATGPLAAELTFTILSDLHLFGKALPIVD